LLDIPAARAFTLATNLRWPTTTPLACSRDKACDADWGHIPAVNNNADLPNRHWDAGILRNIIIIIIIIIIQGVEREIGLLVNPH